MAFDYKKEYKEFYLPKNKPEIITIPKMNFIAVRGKGDPNAEDGDYQKAIGLLYGIAFTIKMSKKTDHRIEGYFDYVVPPLEGFWWQEGIEGIDYAHKELFRWISVIRLPDFVTKEDFAWAVEEATRKGSRGKEKGHRSQGPKAFSGWTRPKSLGTESEGIARRCCTLGRGKVRLGVQARKAN